MKQKLNETATKFAINLVLFFTVGSSNSAFAEGVERHYCTQHGPVFLRFHPEKAAGVYTINANNHMGAMVGRLNGHLFEGSWYEVESHGKIRITFSDEWNNFDATYNLHDAPKTWHKGWVGHLAPAKRPLSFKVGDNTFFCR